MNYIYEITNLSYKFANAKTLFSNFSLKIKQGERWAILGHSGCGKSTLLQLMSGLLKTQHGNIYFNENELLVPNQDIQIIFQDYGLFPWKTVSQNIALPLILKGEKRATIEKELKKILLEFKLLPHSDKYPYELSGGERQRVAICRAMIAKPKVLLMDEPFSALDEFTREILQNYTLQLTNTTNITTVIVTHSIDEAIKMSDKILLFSPRYNQPIIIENNEEKDNFLNHHTKLYLRLRKELKGERDEI